MARQRFIHPDLWSDPTLGQLTPIERLFFIGCFSNADDEGRLLGNPAYLRATIFPYDDLAVDEIKAMRDRVVAVCENLVLYEVDGLEYLAFLKWKKYQNPRYPKPSKLPAPNINNFSLPITTEEILNDSNNTKTTSPAEDKSCNQIDASFQPNSINNDVKSQNDCRTGFGMGMGWDGYGMGMGMDRDGIGVEGEGTPTSPNQPSIPDHTETEREILKELKAVPNYPFNFTQDLEYIRALVVEFPSLNMLEEVKRWRIYKLDKPLKPKSNARLQLRNWCEKAVQWQQERGVKPDGQRGQYSGANTSQAIDLNKFLWKGT